MSKRSEPVLPEYYEVIRGPVVTEKAINLQESCGVVTFEVSDGASKPMIKRAVEAMFGVQVTAVRTLRLPGKACRYRGIKGRKRGSRKAMVSLADGQVIDTASEVR